jgi:DUF438 domain-containing protein
MAVLNARVQRGPGLECFESARRVDVVLDDLRGSAGDSVGFWILAGDRFLYITYHAVRDEDGRYLGCLEVTQDVTHIRDIEGEKRLLE